MSYTQTIQEERYQIYALKKAGHIRTEIAKVVGRDPGTIHRELPRLPRGAHPPGGVFQLLAIVCFLVVTAGQQVTSCYPLLLCALTHLPLLAPFG